MLRLLLFGYPRLESDGAVVPLRRTKALALLARLAVTRQPQERATLLALLWPEFDAPSGRNNLRRELSIVKSTLGDELLLASGSTIAWNGQAGCWVDVAAFSERIAAARRHAHPPGELCVECAALLAEAADLHADEFLAGFGLAESSAFDEWQFFQREELRQCQADALAALVCWHDQLADYEAALGFARRWLALDPLHEPAQRELIRLYAASGQRAAALRQYQECVRLLEKEIGAAPEPATVELYHAIQARQLPAPAAPEAARAAPEPAPLHVLPPQATPIIGRERELTALESYLAAPHPRLISIVGVGGIGKSRLAVELAARQRGAFRDGVFFVALQPIDSPNTLASTIAGAVGCQLSGSEPPPLQLARFLGPRRCLLVLDNFEHLLAGAALVDDLLAAAPDLRLVVTSREALNVCQEWRFPLHGLDAPPAIESSRLDRYAAVQFFVDCARRVRPDFSLAAERDGVARICRLVEGMPLAIELAAAWTNVLPCDAIGAEIERNLAFLSTRLRNVPERHRSMRAAFDYSWALLTGEEQTLFGRLSVFRCGFLPDAAAALGVPLPVLAALADKSLLRVDYGGRYQIHELLRQYAAEQLLATPAEAARSRAAHSSYYLALLSQRQEALVGGDPHAAAEVAAEFENVRAAWQHAVEVADVAGIGGAVVALNTVLFYRGLYGEAIAASEQAIESLRGAPWDSLRDTTLARLLNELGWLYIRVGQVAAARPPFEECRQLYARLRQQPPDGRVDDPLAGLANLALIEGDYAEAVRLGQELLQRSEASGRMSSCTFAWYVLTHAALAQGLYARALHAAEQAHAAVRITKERWFEAYVLNDLGHVAVAQGRYADARRHYHDSYTIREEFKDPEGMALALCLQARVALVSEDWDEANRLYQRGLALYRNIGDRGGLAAALHGLGMVAFAETNNRDAAEYYHEALGLARDIGFVPLILALLASVGALLRRAEQLQPALKLLMLVVCHPSSDRETSDRAQEALLEASEALGPVALIAARAQAQGADLDSAVAETLELLAAPDAMLEPQAGDRVLTLNH